jgi:hypothetical protein
MKTIVSLTSFPARAEIVPLAIRSILKQKPAPDLVVLYLAESQFPDRKLPAELAGMAAKNKNFQIRWTEDSRSYKKLIPALRDFPDDIIVTADDDVIYPQEWLGRLLRARKKYPDAVVGHHVYRMNPNKPYRKWRKLQNKCWRRWLFGRPSFKNFATGVGGVLYPPCALHPDVLRADLFQAFGPTNDDIWFWAMAALNGTKVAIVPNAIKNLPLAAGSQEVGLWNENNVNDRNNKALFAVMEYYPKLKESFA